MADPYWLTGDPTLPVAPTPIKYGPHPDHNAYVWYSNPDVVPEGGVACIVHMHGGGNRGGSGWTTGSAAPFGWAQSASGTYSFEFNNEIAPILLVTIDYPMGMTQWEGLSFDARPQKLSNEPSAAWRAGQIAIAWAKGKALRNEYPFENVNPELVFGSGISAGATWMMLSAFAPALPPNREGATPVPAGLILGNHVPDVNEHQPSVSGTWFMLNGMQRWFGRNQNTVGDEIWNEGKDYQFTKDTVSPATQNRGMHPSGTNELRRRLASSASSLYGSIPILTQYPDNSNATASAPWVRAHDAGQGRTLHEYLESEPLYTASHYHVANPAGDESDVDDVVPTASWASTYSSQENWERMTQLLIDGGYTAITTGIQDGELPGQPFPIPQNGLLMQIGSYMSHQAAADNVFQAKYLVNQQGDRAGADPFMGLQNGRFVLLQDRYSLVRLQNYVELPS